MFEKYEKKGEEPAIGLCIKCGLFHIFKSSKEPIDSFWPTLHHCKNVHCGQEDKPRLIRTVFTWTVAKEKMKVVTRVTVLRGVETARRNLDIDATVISQAQVVGEFAAAVVSVDTDVDGIVEEHLT